MYPATRCRWEEEAEVPFFHRFTPENPVAKIIQKTPLPAVGTADYMTVVETSLGPVMLSHWAGMTDAEAEDTAELLAPHIYHRKATPMSVNNLQPSTPPQATNLRDRLGAAVSRLECMAETLESHATRLFGEGLTGKTSNGAPKTPTPSMPIEFHINELHCLLDRLALTVEMTGDRL